MHHRGGLAISSFFSWYYIPGYFYTAPLTPPVYVQRGDAQAQPQTSFWYYCAAPPGYYPYVSQCPGGWQPVAPRPRP